jgi:hypothetical protein
MHRAIHSKVNVVVATAMMAFHVGLDSAVKKD